MGPFTVTGVIMDESETGCWTNHHSLVEYKGQWILFYHDKDLSPNFDKDRSVRADYLSFNPDGTIQKVIPTLRGVGVADAAHQLQIDRYSAISKEGAAVSFIDDKKTREGWKVSLTNKAAWVQYNRVDFSKPGLKSINVRTLSTTGGTLEIRLDKADGPILAQVDIAKGTDWSNIKGALANAPTGQHDLIVTLRDAGDVQVDWVSFE